MAGFNGRRAPNNVSHYISNLNAIPSAHDVPVQQDENYNIEEELAVFTNAEFFDFDLGEAIEQPSINYDPSQEERARRENAAAHKNGHKLDFVNENYTFPELPPFLGTSPTTSLEPVYQPVPVAPAFASPTHTTPFAYPPTSSTSSGSIPPSNHLALTSPTATTSTPTSPSPSHFAAEEDKRRRNTAASARFRVKKKQREQALERTAKDLGDRAKELEKRVSQLETENEWLRGLVVERNGVVSLESAARDRGAAANKDEGEKEKKKGVGTTETA